MSASALNRFARLSSAAAFLLLIAGGMVTSTGSGLAVPDWPLSYGQYFPRMSGGVFFEHGHRMIAGTVATLTWALAAWLWLRERRRWMRFLAAAAALGIVFQAVLGGLTVLYGLPPAISIAHACLGQTVFCLLVCLAEATGWDESGAAAARTSLSAAAPSGSALEPGAALVRPGLEKLGFLLISALYLQLILGAVLRHTSSGPLLHLIGAALASSAVAWAVYRSLADFPLDSTLQGPAWCLAVLLPVQLILGLAALAMRVQRLAGSGVSFWVPALPTAHVACGALLLGTSTVWTLRVLRARI